MLRQGIAHRVGFALGSRPVKLVIVGKRVGVEPNAVAMNKRRPAAGTAMLGRGLECAQADFGIGPVDLGEMEIREIGHQARNVAAGRVHLDRHADRVAVVLHAKDHGSFWFEAVFSASQNSPCDVEPSPRQASTTSSPWKVTSRKRDNRLPLWPPLRGGG